MAVKTRSKSAFESVDRICEQKFSDYGSDIWLQVIISDVGTCFTDLMLMDSYG